MHTDGLRTWIEIRTSALAKNYATFRKLIDKKCKLMAVAKSNAYGHSLIDYALLMQKMGADWIGVDSITEAVTLRKAGIERPILILGYTLPERYAEAAKLKVSITLSNFDALRALTRTKIPTPLSVHIKIDTGMRRQGFYVSELKKVLDTLAAKKSSLHIEGIYTHFAAAKNPAFPKDTLSQIEQFEQALAIAHAHGYTHLIRHAAATSGTIVFPQSHYDMVRVGIGMYGLWPSTEVEAAFRDTMTLVPALSWKTIISDVKQARRGDRIGYDFTETLSKDTKIAVCPIGYWHGYPRALSSIGRVHIGNREAKVLGRISMDMIVIDLSGVPNAKTGDEVTLLGKHTPADEFAKLADTSSYEIVTRINPLIKRIYTT